MTKKQGKYVRRDALIKQQSERRYRVLLYKNFVAYRAQYGFHTRYLSKKGKLGIFSKFVTGKKKVKAVKKKVKPQIKKKNK